MNWSSVSNLRVSRNTSTPILSEANKFKFSTYSKPLLAQFNPESADYKKAEQHNR